MSAASTHERSRHNPGLRIRLARDINIVTELLFYSLSHLKVKGKGLNECIAVNGNALQKFVKYIKKAIVDSRLRPQSQ